MQKQVYVRIDQARQQGAVAQIDQLGGGRMRDRSAHFHDAFAGDEHLAGLKHLAGLDIQQARGAQHDGRLAKSGAGDEQRGAEPECSHDEMLLPQQHLQHAFLRSPLEGTRDIGQRQLFRDQLFDRDQVAAEQIERRLETPAA
jgi:hypothetical protein